MKAKMKTRKKLVSQKMRKTTTTTTTMMTTTTTTRVGEGKGFHSSEASVPVVAVGTDEGKDEDEEEASKSEDEKNNDNNDNNDDDNNNKKCGRREGLPLLGSLCSSCSRRHR